MAKRFKEYSRFERSREEGLEKELSENDVEIPHNWWLEDIEKLTEPNILIKELDGAKKIAEKEIELKDKLKSGEMSKERYDHENLEVLGKKKAKYATRSALESEGITYDDLGDVSEDWGIMTSMNPKVAEMKEGVKELIHDQGPEFAKEHADRMLEEGKISESTHKSILRQVRLHGKE